MDKVEFLGQIEAALAKQELQMTGRAAEAVRKAGFTQEDLNDLLLHPEKMTLALAENYDVCYVLSGKRTRKAKVGMKGDEMVVLWLEYNKVPFIL
ncbi:hypothetical protein [Gorillibacterium massiliense]|uniref:hypothetical protein n=1 Tax=Gorillibacterium massiliense TaxID=1280390 RepID=UPI0004BCE3FB|nr:hypothetical protein [Gorillibacterium massiliense]